jgi:hypothetical protein
MQTGIVKAIQVNSGEFGSKQYLNYKLYNDQEQNKSFHTNLDLKDEIWVTN